MRCLLQLAILLAALADSTAFAADRIQLAQVVTPGQVAPVPLVPTPLISSQTSTACLVGCDTQVMTCQNACVAAGQAALTAIATPPSSGGPQLVRSIARRNSFSASGRATSQPRTFASAF